MQRVLCVGLHIYNCERVSQDVVSFSYLLFQTSVQSSCTRQRDSPSNWHNPPHQQLRIRQHPLILQLPRHLYDPLSNLLSSPSPRWYSNASH